ncbi:hypothetical protein [Hymenobacter properus]|uniref:STAS/SEC14 domain-containing protein n=1 Tax=Hymenobacter properus TaxID=2791026 RepID=A0A931BK65_9BACT|nr:hypothetical protein [Hymenobacter properus]MBF9143753.1 hypothetical protein [Hymenobacter properus]MBR7722566.1 hypothetical protein [Microvirga sp. SRT04]
MSKLSPRQKSVLQLPYASTKLREGGRPVHVTYDSFGAVAAEYTFFPLMRVLYVRWHGHVTADELVRAAQVGLRINQQLQPLGLMHDIRGTSGDWGDAAPWVEHEWIPGIQAHCASLRSIGFLSDADTPAPYTNLLLLDKLNQEFEFQRFYSLRAAWRWMEQRTMHRQD